MEQNCTNTDTDTQTRVYVCVCMCVCLRVSVQDSICTNLSNWLRIGLGWIGRTGRYMSFHEVLV